MILCGLFGAGKTTLGKKLAEKHNLPFYDTDLLMEKIHKKAIGEIWQSLGEEKFRDLETATILALEKKPSVIAIGGGAWFREINRLYLKQLGKTIYLKASISTLWTRLHKKGFPIFLKDKQHFQQIALKRFPLYEHFCDDTIKTDQKSIERCVIHLGKFFESPPGESPTVGQ